MKDKLRQLKRALQLKLAVLAKKEEPVNESPSLSKETLAKRVENSPYLQSKLLWNDLYGGVEEQLLRSRRISWFLSGVLVLCVFMLVVVSSRSSVTPVPFLVHGDEIITATNIDSPSLNSVRPKLSPYFAKNVIRNARTVSVDRSANRRMKEQALTFSDDQARSFLLASFKVEDPNLIGEKLIRSVHITSLLQRSDSQFLIHWQERWQSAKTGRLIKTLPYIGELRFEYREGVGDQQALHDNPLGFYVTELAWSVDEGV